MLQHKAIFIVTAMRILILEYIYPPPPFPTYPIGAACHAYGFADRYGLLLWTYTFRIMSKYSKKNLFPLNFDVHYSFNTRYDLHTITQLLQCHSRAVQSSVTDCFLFPVVPISNEYEIIKFQYRVLC